MVNCIRGSIRIPVELPVEVQWKGRGGKQQQATGKTATMSGNGLLMALPTQLRHEMRIIITVTLPMEITRVPLELYCQGRVVGRKPAGPPTGVGAIIDDYQFRPAQLPA